MSRYQVLCDDGIQGLANLFALPTRMFILHPDAPNKLTRPLDTLIRLHHYHPLPPRRTRPLRHPCR
jgi:hypothetical protein